MVQNIEIFLKISQCSRLNKRRVLLKDVASIYSTNTVMSQKVGELELFVFSEDMEKCSFSVLKVLETIGSRYPEVTVTALGETDFIVEYDPAFGKKTKKAAEYLKVALVCLTVFFGSAFTIMTFNKDAAVEDVFGMIYKLTKGVEQQGPAELELSYCIGLPIGIILFFNHFLRKKIDSDPTPLQVQMRQYEKDVNATIIENASREGREEDV